MKLIKYWILKYNINTNIKLFSSTFFVYVGWCISQNYVKKDMKPWCSINLLREPSETLEYTWYMLLIPQWYQNYDKLIKLAHGYQACNHTYPTPIIISKMGRVVWGYILGTPLAPVWWEPGMNKYCMKYIFWNSPIMISWFNSHINRIFVNKGLQQI